MKEVNDVDSKYKMSHMWTRQFYLKYIVLMQTGVNESCSNSFKIRLNFSDFIFHHFQETKI